MEFGRGDAILRYPELVGADKNEGTYVLDHVAVHLSASAPNKIPPRPELLRDMLRDAHVKFLLVGLEAHPPGSFTGDVEIVRHARKFIGTLSVFNCVAQVFGVPTLALVNRSIKEPTIYDLMYKNRARVEAWNLGEPIEAIYARTVEWAVS